MSVHAQPASLRAQPATRLDAGAVAERRLAGLLLFALAAGFLTVIMLGASIAPAYDYGAAAISDLGVIPETALLFNATLVAIGILDIGAGYLFYRSHRRAWILGLFVLGGTGALGAGLFPLSRGDLHSLFALLAFVFFNLQALAVASVIHGPMRWISALAGIVGLVYVVIMVIGDGGNPAVFGAIGHGGTERMIAYPTMLWMVALGGYLMAGCPRPD
ncbi:MAG TPA: DUF998 domain-containing protein [Candidatus Limnocylindria bacterium]